MRPFKRGAVCAALLTFAIWPAIQIGLIRSFDVNPWKLAGWGMYSAPQLPARVQLLCRTSDDVGIYELRSIQPELETEFSRFLRLRHGLREIVRPDRLARAILGHYSAIDGVDIVVLQPVLDLQTGMIVEQSTTYAYRR